MRCPSSYRQQFLRQAGFNVKPFLSTGSPLRAEADCLTCSFGYVRWGVFEAPSLPRGLALWMNSRTGLLSSSGRRTLLPKPDRGEDIIEVMATRRHAFYDDGGVGRCYSCWRLPDWCGDAKVCDRHHELLSSD
jgi:hypothetical protein